MNLVQITEDEYGWLRDQIEILRKKLTDCQPGPMVRKLEAENSHLKHELQRERMRLQQKDVEIERLKEALESYGG